MIQHEFKYNTKESMRCKHCGKLFVYCVNRDGTYNTRCVKRKELNKKT